MTLDVQAKTKVTVATLSPDEYPPDGKKFFDDFSKKYGDDNPDPYAIYGYEAMSLSSIPVRSSARTAQTSRP